MTEIKDIVNHVESDVDVVLKLLEHLKIHTQKARYLYESGSVKELSEIGEHLLEIDAKIHELYHHILAKDTTYDPEKDLTTKKEPKNFEKNK